METVADLKKRVAQILHKLRRKYPDVNLALDFATPLDLLIALILAAQCTDARVNQVTAGLFRIYRSAKDWAELDRDVLEEAIRSTGFYRNKARVIQECTKMLIDDYDSEIPVELEELLKLPGVGRKTANILRGNAFGQPAIGVDTHVGRLSRRVGLSKAADPDKVEEDLAAIVSKASQIRFCQLLQLHGRTTCGAQKPKCDVCVIEKECARIGV